MIFYIKETYRIIRTNLASFLLIAIFTTIALIFLSFATLFFANYGKLEAKISNSLEAKIFLKENISHFEAKTFEQEIKQYPIINKIHFVDKSEAKEIITKKMKLKKESLSEIEFPYSFTLNFKTTNSQDLYKFLDEITRKRIVDSVIYPKVVLINVLKNLKIILISFVFITLFIFSGVVLINKRLYISILNNDKDILQIKEYVGTDFFKVIIPYYLSSYFVVISLLILLNLTFISVNAIIFKNLLKIITLDKFLILINIVLFFFSLMMGLYQIPNKTINNFLGK